MKSSLFKFYIEIVILKEKVSWFWVFCFFFFFFQFPPNAKKLFSFTGKAPCMLSFSHFCMVRRACPSWVYPCLYLQSCHNPVCWYLSHRLVDTLFTQGADKLSVAHLVVLRTKPMLQVCASTSRWCHISGTNRHQPPHILLLKLPFDRHLCKILQLKRVRNEENN